MHEDFRCHLVHTGETFDREAWVRLNADYPGFERMVLDDCVVDGDRAVVRAIVTGTSDGQPQQFAVASFGTLDGLIVELTEVWTDVGVEAPAGTRPS